MIKCTTSVSSKARASFPACIFLNSRTRSGSLGERRGGFLDALHRLGQAGNLGGLLGRPLGEQLVEVAAVALLRAVLFLHRLDQGADGGGGVELQIEGPHEAHHFPVRLLQHYALLLGQYQRQRLAPLFAVAQIALGIGLDELAVEMQLMLFGRVLGHGGSSGCRDWAGMVAP